MSEDKVKIKMNIKGIDVEIETSPKHIKEAINQVIDSLCSLTTQERISMKESIFSPASCKEALELLWKEGWFSEERRLSDVWLELSKRGYNFDRSAIAHALHDLTKEGILTRLGRTRRYRYIQKTPYVMSTK